jgi:hypothetical protein
VLHPAVPVSPVSRKPLPGAAHSQLRRSRAATPPIPHQTAGTLARRHQSDKRCSSGTPVADDHAPGLQFWMKLGDYHLIVAFCGSCRCLALTVAGTVCRLWSAGFRIYAALRHEGDRLDWLWRLAELRGFRRGEPAGMADDALGSHAIRRTPKRKLDKRRARRAVGLPRFRLRTRGPPGAFLLVRGDVWSGAGSNRRPSAFQVNHAKRCADLQKRTSPPSETALGGRCKIHANRLGHSSPAPGITWVAAADQCRRRAGPGTNEHDQGDAGSGRPAAGRGSPTGACPSLPVSQVQIDGSAMSGSPASLRVVRKYSAAIRPRSARSRRNSVLVQVRATARSQRRSTS